MIFNFPCFTNYIRINRLLLTKKDRLDKTVAFFESYDEVFKILFVIKNKGNI